jgi:hypothetical protein
MGGSCCCCVIIGDRLLPYGARLVIPSFNPSMVLPPFVGDSPGVPAMMSPYKNTISAFVKRFATSAQRVLLLKGLLSYSRAACCRHFGRLSVDRWELR